MQASSPQKKRIRDPQRTRERVLTAAVDIIAEKGADSLSMKEVVSRAEVSRSAAYQHFKDRNELLEQAKNWIKLRLHKGIKKFDKDATLFDRILYNTKLVMQNPEVSRIMLVDSLVSGDYFLTDPLCQDVASRINQSQQTGGLREDLDPEVSTCIHLGNIASALLFLEQHRGEDIDLLAERYSREWCRYLEGGVLPQ